MNLKMIHDSLFIEQNIKLKLSQINQVQMIVSENGSFLNMELPKQGTTMAPMVTRVVAYDMHANQKRIRYESKMQEDKMLLPPKDFKAWRSKLDKLKQVVRQTNPNEIQLGQSQFTMSKRPPRGQSHGISSQIQSQCFNLEESLLSKDCAPELLHSHEHQSTEVISPASGDEDDLSSNNTQSQDADVDVVDENAAKLVDVVERTEEQYDATSRLSAHSDIQVDSNSKMQHNNNVQEESCLGYLFPKVNDDSTQARTSAYGSRLGPQHIASQQRNRAGNVPGASNLKALMTYPKQIVSKSGAILGYSNVKYPKSFYEEQLDRQRLQLKSASIHSPSTRQSRTRQNSQLSAEQISQQAGFALNEVEMQAHGIGETELTGQVSEDASALMGWDAGQNSTLGPSRALSSSIVQSTRVGGATFVKNKITSADPVSAPAQESTTGMNDTHQSLIKRENKFRLGQNQAQTQQRMNNSRHNKSQPVMKRQKRRQIAGLTKEVPSQNQTPLQLANLSVLMANLQKTGNLLQANEEALKIKQQKSKKYGQKYTKKMNGDMLKSAMDFATSSANSKNQLNETMQSFYMTDDRGNLMKLSKSTIFETNFDNQFQQHRMQPMLNNNQITQGSYDEQQQEQRHLSQYQSAIMNTGVENDKNYTRKTVVNKGENADGCLVGSALSHQMTEPPNSGNKNQLANRYCSQHDGDTMEPQQTSTIQSNSQTRAPMPFKHWPLMAAAKTAKKQLKDQNNQPQMIVTGGHATMTNKYMNASLSSSHKQRVINADPNIQSNKDLHMLDDPTLTIKSGGIQASAPPAIESEIVGETQLRMEIEAVSQGGYARSPRPENDQLPIQWQVLSSNQQNFDRTNTNDFQARASLRENMTTGNPPGTTSSTGSRPSNMGPVDSIASSNILLPIMLQNMKKQQIRSILNQANNTSQDSDYQVIGRSVSPAPGSSHYEETHRRQSSTRGDANPNSQKPKNSNVFMSNSNHPSVGKMSGTTTAVFAGQQSMVVPPGGKLMPIVTNQNSVGAAVPSDPLSPLSQEMILEHPEIMKVEEIIASNVKSGKKHKVTGATGRQQQQRGTSKTLMRFDDDNDSTSNGVVTVLGDKNILRISQKQDGKSRDKFGVQGETQKLENTSSKQMMTQENNNSFRIGGCQQGTKKAILNSPKASNRTEEAFRQPIPIKKRATNPEEINNAGLEMSQVSSLGNLKGKQCKAPNSGQRSRNDEIITSESNIIAGGQVMSPTDIVFLRADSAQELMALQQLNLQKGSMLINLGTTNNNIEQAKMQELNSTEKKGRNSKSVTKSSNVFNKPKRSTIESIQKFVDNKANLQRARFNATISSVNIGVQQQQQEQKQKGFLPTMPFKQSNFAKTQKAIKQIRQGSLQKRQRQQNMSGQFMRLDDYTAMHGQYAAGDSRMYLRPEENTSAGAQDSTAGDNEESRGDHKQLYSMTHTSIEAQTENQNFVTATSFGPTITKQGSLLKNPQQSRKEVLVNANNNNNNNDYTSEIVEQYSDSNLSKDKVILAQNQQKNLVDAGSTSEEGRSLHKNTTANQRQFNQAGQGTQHLSDYVNTQRNNTTVGTDSKSKLNSIDKNFEAATNPQLMSAEGSITIINRNTPHTQSIQEKVPAAPTGSLSPRGGATKKGGNSDAVKAQKGRQVIVHKLTMGTTNTMSLHDVQNPKSQQLIAVGTSNPSPSPLNEQLLLNSKQPSLAVDKPVQQVAAKPEAKGPRFSNNRGRSQKMLPQTQNIINLGVVPIVTFGAAADSTVDSLFRLSCSKGYNSNLNLNMTTSTTTVGAKVMMTNSELKARHFIDKQRKRTATLGAQRHHQYIYKVSGNSENQHPANNAAPPQGDQVKSPSPNKSGQDNDFKQPPVVDFNGDSLYDSGMMIKQASIVNQSQAKYIQNRRTTTTQQPSKQPVNKQLQSKTSLVSPMTMIGRRKQGVKENELYLQESSEENRPINLNQRSVVALSRINHQVLGTTTGPRPINTNVSRSPTNKHYNGEMAATPELNHQRQQLVLTGNNVGPMSSNRQGDHEAGSGYGEYLRGANTDLADSCMIRSKTPGVEPTSQIGLKNKKKTGLNNNNNYDKKVGERNNSKSSLIISNDTLKAMGQKSGLNTSDGGAISKSNQFASKQSQQQPPQ